MPAKKPESPADVERWFRTQAAALWPAALGSLGIERAPASGSTAPRVHVATSIPVTCCTSASRDGAPASHVPDELVPQIQRPSRTVVPSRDLLHEAGRRYTDAAKHQRALAQGAER